MSDFLVDIGIFTSISYMCLCFYTSIVYYHNECGLFFISTNHLLEFALNFFHSLYMGHHIDQSFIKLQYEFSYWLMSVHSWGGPYMGHVLLFLKTACLDLFNFIIIYQQHAFMQL